MILQWHHNYCWSRQLEGHNAFQFITSVKHVWTGVWCAPGMRPWALIFSTYTIPLGAILHSPMSDHLSADDTQLYCASHAGIFLYAIPKLEACVPDIPSWMITDKLKMNDEKWGSHDFFFSFSCTVSRKSKDRNTVVASSPSFRNLSVNDVWQSSWYDQTCIKCV